MIKKTKLGEDYYAEVYLGSDYSLTNCTTVGQLKMRLEEIIQDLPNDNQARISEIHCRDRIISYTLEEGIYE